MKPRIDLIIFFFVSVLIQNPVKAGDAELGPPVQRFQKQNAIIIVGKAKKEISDGLWKIQIANVLRGKLNEKTVHLETKLNEDRIGKLKWMGEYSGSGNQLEKGNTFILGLKRSDEKSNQKWEIAYAPFIGKAIFPSVESITPLFSEDSNVGNKAVVKAIIKGIKSKNKTLQRFCALELRFAPQRGIAEYNSDKNKEKEHKINWQELLPVLKDQKTDDQAKRYLFKSLRYLSKEEGIKQNLLNYSRNLLKEAADYETLDEFLRKRKDMNFTILEYSLDMLREEAKKEDIPLISHFVKTNRFSRQAVLSLHDIDPQIAVKKAKERLQMKTDLSENNKRFLNKFIKEHSQKRK